MVGVEGAWASAKAGRKKSRGEKPWTVEMPLHPAPINVMTDPRAKHLKTERTFTEPSLRGLYDLSNVNS